jgi:hypothetical protein
MPIDTGRPSVKARPASWQVAHETLPSAESSGSKKSFLPSATSLGRSGSGWGGDAAMRPAAASATRMDLLIVFQRQLCRDLVRLRGARAPDDER